MSKKPQHSLHRTATMTEKKTLEIFANKIQESGFVLSYGKSVNRSTQPSLKKLLQETIADVKKTVKG